MIVENITNQYQGLSSETKITKNQYAGSTFFETDTSNIYIYDGITWVPMGANDTSSINTINAELADVVHQPAFNTAIANISASPKGTYVAISNITTAFPSGNANIYLTSSDGKWNYWNGTVWTAGGVYQATAIANGSVSVASTNFITAKTQYLYVANQTVGQLWNLVSTNIVQQSYANFTAYAPFTVNAGTYYLSATAYVAQSYVYDTVTLAKTLMQTYIGTSNQQYIGLITIVNTSVIYLCYDNPYIITPPMFVNDIVLPSVYSEGIYQVSINNLFLNNADIQSIATGVIVGMNALQPYPYYNTSYIYGHKLYTNDSGQCVTAKYNGIDALNTPNGLKAKIIFTTGTGGGSSADLICDGNGLSSISNITASSLHIVFCSTCVYISIWVAGVYTVIATYIYPTPCVCDGITVYNIGWSVSGNTITANAPDGTIYTYTDTRIPTGMGRYCTFEAYWSGSANSRPIYTYMEIDVASNPVFTDNFNRPDGLIGIATTGQSYVQLHEAYENS